MVDVFVWIYRHVPYFLPICKQLVLEPKNFQILVKFVVTGDVGITECIMRDEVLEKMHDVQFCMKSSLPLSVSIMAELVT